MTASPSLSIGLVCLSLPLSHTSLSFCHSFSIPVPLPLRPHCVLAHCRMKGSWCQSLSLGSGSCQHHSALLLGSVEEGLAALKAQCITQSLLCLPPVLSSPLYWCRHSLTISSHTAYLAFVTVLSRVLSLLNQDEVFLCCQTSSLQGQGVQRTLAVASLIYKAGWCLMTSSRWETKIGREDQADFPTPPPPCPLYQNLYFYTMHSHT